MNVFKILIFASKNRKMNNNTIENLKAYCRQEGYGDDYIFMTDRMEHILCGRKSVKLDVFLFIYCSEGEVKMELNNSPVAFGKDDLLLCQPNTIINNVLASFDHKVRIVCFSNRFVQRMTQTDKHTWQSIEFIRTHPVKHLNADEVMDVSQYMRLMWRNAFNDADVLRRTVLLHLSSALFSEMIASTSNDFETDAEVADETLLKQGDYIFKRFIDAVTADNGHHRTLGYYAERLCYSTKYLSNVVKQVSGKNALTLINENAIENIIHELKYSEKTVKQIAFEFDFSNNSFFSRFFKQHVGVSPVEFRSNFMKENDERT